MVSSVVGGMVPRSVRDALSVRAGEDRNEMWREKSGIREGPSGQY